MVAGRFQFGIDLAVNSPIIRSETHYVGHKNSLGPAVAEEKAALHIRDQGRRFAHKMAIPGLQASSFIIALRTLLPFTRGYARHEQRAVHTSDFYHKKVKFLRLLSYR